MKKVLLTALLLGIAVLTSGAFAQSTVVDAAAGHKGGGDISVSHKVHVAIPKVVVLRVLSTGGSPAMVNFDFTTTAGLTAYQNALDGTSGNPIPYTTALGNGNTTLDSVQVLTNTGNAPTVKVTWAVDSSPATPNTSDLAATDLYFNGSNAATAGVAVTPASPTGWQPVAVPADFSIRADGATTAGDMTFVVTYTTSAN